MSQEQNNRPPTNNLENWRFPHYGRSENFTDSFLNSLREGRRQSSVSEAQSSPLTVNFHGPPLDGGLLVAGWPPQRTQNVGTNVPDPRLANTRGTGVTDRSVPYFWNPDLRPRNHVQIAAAAGSASGASLSGPERGTSATTVPRSDVRRHNPGHPAPFANPIQRAPGPKPRPQSTHPRGPVEFPIQPTDQEWHALSRFWNLNPGKAPPGWEPTKLRGASEVRVIRRERRVTRTEPYPTGNAARKAAAATRRTQQTPGTNPVIASPSTPSTPSAAYLIPSPSTAYLIPSTTPTHQTMPSSSPAPPAAPPVVPTQPPISHFQTLATQSQSQRQLQQRETFPSSEEVRRKRAEDLDIRRVNACPVEGCGRRYVHRRDLRHHVTKEHPGSSERLVEG